MNSKLNSNHDNEINKEEVDDLHTNKEMSDNKTEEKSTQVPKPSFSPFSVIAKSLPLALGVASIGILITVVLYLLLK